MTGFVLAALGLWAVLMAAVLLLLVGGLGGRKQSPEDEWEDYRKN